MQTIMYDAIIIQSYTYITQISQCSKDVFNTAEIRSAQENRAIFLGRVQSQFYPEV